MPFMSFVTRCCKRPEPLERCRASVLQQSDKDFEHILIFDEVGRGISWANQQFYVNRQRVKGDYVYLLDDDDYLIEPNFISLIKQIVARESPDVIMVKMQTEAHIFPTPDVWRKKPILGSIGTSCFCVSNPVYQKHIKEFGRRSCGDIAFIRSVFNDAYKIYWFDKIISRIDAAHRSAHKQ